MKSMKILAICLIFLAGCESGPEEYRAPSRVTPASQQEDWSAPLVRNFVDSHRASPEEVARWEAREKSFVTLEAGMPMEEVLKVWGTPDRISHSTLDGVSLAVYVYENHLVEYSPGVWTRQPWVTPTVYHLEFVEGKLRSHHISVF